MAIDDTGPTGSAFDRQLARIAVGGYDDMQAVREACMNRARDVVRKRREDIPFDEVEDEKDPEERDYDSEYEDDNLPELIEEMRANGTLSDDEFDYLRMILEAGATASQAEQQFADVMEITATEPIYQQYLQHVYGVSTTMTARLLHDFGYCESSEKVSNLWSYTGLAPGQTRTRGEQLDHNPQAKKDVWLVADGMIKQGDNSKYRSEFYDPYKEKQVSRMHGSMCNRCGEPTFEHVLREVDNTTHRFCPDLADADLDESMAVTLGDFEIAGDHPEEATPPWSQSHADNRARRYLGKKFLKHYWYIARQIQGYETPEEWIVTHGGHDKTTDTFENPQYALDWLQRRG